MFNHGRFRQWEQYVPCPPPSRLIGSRGRPIYLKGGRRIGSYQACKKCFLGLFSWPGEEMRAWHRSVSKMWETSSASLCWTVHAALLYKKNIHPWIKLRKLLKLPMSLTGTGVGCVNQVLEPLIFSLLWWYVPLESVRLIKYDLHNLRQNDKAHFDQQHL